MDQHPLDLQLPWFLSLSLALCLCLFPALCLCLFPALCLCHPFLCPCPCPSLFLLPGLSPCPSHSERLSLTLSPDLQTLKIIICNTVTYTLRLSEPVRHHFCTPIPASLSGLEGLPWARSQYSSIPGRASKLQNQTCQTSVVLLGHVSSLHPFVFAKPTICNINHDTAVQEMDFECVLLEEPPSCSGCYSRRRSKEKMDSGKSSTFPGGICILGNFTKRLANKNATLPSKVTCGRRVYLLTVMTRQEPFSSSSLSLWSSIIHKTLEVFVAQTCQAGICKNSQPTGVALPWLGQATSKSLQRAM